MVGKIPQTSFLLETLPGTIRSLVLGMVDLVYPPLCLICEHHLENAAQQLCTDCLDGLKLIGRPHAQFSVPGEICIQTAWALFEFDEPLQQVIHHLKYSRRRKPIGRILDHYEERILGQLPKGEVDWVISVPLHPRKLRERGYNQVDDLSRWLAEKLHARLGNHLVKRIKYTQTQTKLNAGERLENLQGAFGVTLDEPLRGAHVLLVDDVLTTGATSNALATELNRSGAARIDLLTLATPPFGNA